MTETRRARISAARRHREDSREYRVIYAATLLLFVLVVALERIFGARGPSSQGRESLIDEARAMAHTAIPFAYMR